MLIRCFTGLLAVALCHSSLSANELDPALRAILSLKSEGDGNLEAAHAWREITEAGPPAILPVLEAMDQADPVAANWLRTALDAIVGNAKDQDQVLPTTELETFLADRSNAPRARRFAFEVVVDLKPERREPLLETMLDDPSVELRRDAIDLMLQRAEPLKAEMPDAYKDRLRELFAATRDKDQSQAIAEQLKELGEEVDFVAQFGFITDWHLIGPFDSTDGVGFAKVYPPEQDVDLKSEPVGKEGKPLQWVWHSTEDPYGEVDLNTALSKHMGACAYAYAVVESTSTRRVEIRFGSPNATKIYLNGEEIFAHEEYHHGSDVDQYTAKGTLRKGRNELLVKVCQNEQTEEWAQAWGYQLRISDETGGKVPVAIITE